MKTITVGNKEYQLEFTFAAVEHRGLVQKMFNIMSGAYIVKRTNVVVDTEIEPNKRDMAEAMLDGTSEMVAEIPHICIVAFYAGLLEHNPLNEEESKNLMKAYMRENKMSFNALFEYLKTCMEEDGFFDLSGLTEMLNQMNKKEEKQTEKKTPQDHKKKQTSTK